MEQEILEHRPQFTMRPDHQWQQHVVVFLNVPNEKVAMDVLASDRICYLPPHQLPFLIILLLMVLGNGRDSFFNIRAGCEIRRWSEVGRR